MRWLNDGLHEFNWRDLQVFITEAGPDTALYRAMNPEWMWDQDALLLADAVDALRILAWQKTEDARKRKNQPKPIPRPGIGVDENQTQHKGTGVPMDEYKARRAKFFQKEVTT